MLVIKQELKELIQAKLIMYDLCDTSSDDDNTTTVSKVAQKEKIKAAEDRILQPTRNVKNRLPGVTEKWNEDLSEHEAQNAEMSTEDEEISEDDDEEKEEEYQGDSLPIDSRMEEVDDDEEKEEETYDNTDPYENSDEVEKDIQSTLLTKDIIYSSDSEVEGEVIIEKQSVDTSISSRNSRVSKSSRTEHPFSYPDTQFTANEDIVSPIFARQNEVPISRPFVSAKLREVPSIKNTSTLKACTRSSQLTIPLDNAIKKKPKKTTTTKNGPKRVIEEWKEESEAENVYSWDPDQRGKRTRRNC